MKTLAWKLICITALVLYLASGAWAQYYWVTYFTSSGQIVSSSAIQGYYGFPVLANSWSAVGINPLTADHDIYVCPDQTIFYDYESADVYATSTGNAGVRDFTVTNGFYWGDYADHFALVGYGTSSPYYLEAEWGLPNLTLGAVRSSSFATNEVLNASQVNLAAGQAYTAIAARTSGDLDPGLFVFSPDIRGGSRDTATWSANTTGVGGTETLTFTPTTDGPHCIVVTDENGASGGYDLTIEPIPANDEWCSATVIPSLPYSTSENTLFATTGATDPITTCGAAGSKQLKSVWFTITPTYSGQIQADTFTSDYDTVLAVYSGSCSGSYLAIVCNDDFGGYQSKLTWNAAAGTKYYIEAMAFGTTYRPDLAGGNLALHVSYGPPANDNCSSAILLTNPDDTKTQMALGGTTEAGEPVPCAAGIYDTVWYQFVPAQTGVVTLSTVGSAYDTVLGVYTGACGALTLYACDDNEPGGSDNTSALALNVTAGVPYLVQVGAHETTGGGSLRLEYHSGPPCTTIAAARCLAPGARVSLCNKLLTGSSGSLPFIQEPDRSASAAIGGSGPNAGSAVTLVGNTVTAGGNFIVSGNAVGVAYPLALHPLGMTNKTVGGPAACNQAGVTGAGGVNNFGLLVRTWGKVTSVDTGSNSYWIDDGSKLAYNAGHIGLRVWTVGPLPHVDDYRMVTGHPWMGTPAGTPILYEVN